MNGVWARRLIALGAIGLASCASNAQIEAGPATVTTGAGNESTEVTVSGDDVSQSATEDEPSQVTTPEEAAGLTESSLTDSTAPLVTSPDDVEPKGPIGSEALAQLLITEMPGFERLTDAGADRYLSIDDASLLQPDPTEELPLLETRGYQGGWTRAFRDADNNVLVTTVYDFVSALEADFYLEDGTITIIGDGGRIFEVESIPDARGFRQDIQDDSGQLVIYGITFTRDNQWFLIYLLGEPDAGIPSIVLAAAEAQVEAASN